MHSLSGGIALVEALKKQKIVAGNADLAEKIASVGEVIDVPAGTAIIQQGADDGDVYLIVNGGFHIVVNGKTIARRTANDHVGEMAAILPVQRRAASVVAHEESTVVKLSESLVAELGERYPQIWLCLARELAHRVEQRNTVATSVSEKVRVFIIASGTAGKIARAIHSAMKDEPFHMVIWSDEDFRNRSIDSLENMLDQSDVAVAVAEPNVAAGSPRDRILFELGFLMGRLGRHRTFLIEPRGELPAKLAGINTAAYQLAEGEDLTQALAPACDKLRKSFHELGPNR